MNLIDIINSVTKKTKLVFPIHPRTLKNLEKFNLLDRIENKDRLTFTEAMNYLSFQKLISDAKSNKITLAVILGEKQVKWYHFFLIISAIVLSSLFGILYYTSPFNLIYMIAYIPLLIHLNKVKNNTDVSLLDPELKKLALTTVLLAVLMGAGHLM